MLISFGRKFIYIKTVKTGSTAVEIYFQPECVEPGKTIQLRTPECVGPHGVVGARGPGAPDARYRNHLPAGEMRAFILEDFGPNVWEESFRFCVVRNPFERAVSLFWMRTPDRRALAEAPFDEIRSAFADAVRAGWATSSNQRKYMIDGEPVVDSFVRHDRLTEDVEDVCGRLGMTFEPARLERINTRPVQRDEPARDYFDEATRETVARIDPWEIARFGYALSNAR